ncbi:glutathione synthase [Sulfuriflexus mobilis]|uniref:glutathione synthase n=1 Tax=Sulfuriflexus mobilis TaxID=1811807 RepID=UPI000F84A2E8|nr:glutathione synthase [Sulfuriflexus mobilis]
MPDPNKPISTNPVPARPIRLGVVMDPIGGIKVAKDSTLAMLLEAQARGWHIDYLELEDLSLRDGRALGRLRKLELNGDADDWYRLGDHEETPLAELDVILMRKDPPFDMEYIYSTYILEAAQAEGVLVVNRPESIRNANEKLFAARFPDCMPPSQVTRRADALRAFLAAQGDIILKPLGEMGGASIFRIREGDPNTNVIIETLTGNGSHYIMAQRFVPEISAGDKRILLIDGEPVPYALARIPTKGETRGNLAAGGRGEGVELSARDREICARVGPVCRELGLVFVGIDVIGDYLTEINSTSPTCIRELDALYDLNISAQLLDVIEKKLS